MTEVEYGGLSRIIRKLQFFRLMKGSQFDRLMARIELCSYERGETIFRKGDPPMAFYIVYTGGVRIKLGYKYMGLVRRMATIVPGGIFGEMAIFEKRVHSASAKADQPTQLFVFTYEQFDELMKDDPDFAELIKFVITKRKAENIR